MNDESTAPRRPLGFVRRRPAAMRNRAMAFFEELRGRRSVRSFAPDPIPPDVLELCIAAATQAPSGANKQPWTYVVVTDPELKARIRAAAEAEERAFYGGRAPQRWLNDLVPFGTDAHKPFLEAAPALVVVFAQRGSAEAKNYYVSESVGLSVGMFLAACAHAGLATLTHTPSPMGFLSEVLGRPETERPYLLIPVGYPEDGCTVPDIRRKPRQEVMVWAGVGEQSASDVRASCANSPLDE